MRIIHPLPNRPSSTLHSTLLPSQPGRVDADEAGPLQRPAYGDAVPVDQPRTLKRVAHDGHVPRPGAEAREEERQAEEHVVVGVKGALLEYDLPFWDGEAPVGVLPGDVGVALCFRELNLFPRWAAVLGSVHYGEGEGGIPGIGEDGISTVLGEKANPRSGVLDECWRFPTLEIRDEPL
ncbi:unnamed protein product [Clonostachys byssicola]|uniref:Uncharacterized protein n=1 Tax=Clonostachys byssicola TaxID=160290 RepID=A0A9N9YBE1_9HYPO|nr:unnamed protein product [Clonostachys byssicola]